MVKMKQCSSPFPKENRKKGNADSPTVFEGSYLCTVTFKREIRKLFKLHVIDRYT